MFISVNGKAKKVLEIFAGGTDNKAHSVKELFGSVNGIAKLLYSGVPAATNGFDMFTWGEIKQLANEGRLLDYFNLYDKVTVKLKTPLEKTLDIYTTDIGSTIKVPQKQTEMQFQIVELTDTKMRLMTPRANILGTQDFSIRVSTGAVLPDKWMTYAANYAGNTNQARANIKDIWGLCGVYNSLKLIQNSLPDDLVNVLSVCARPIIKWEKDGVTNNIIKEYDEDLRVRQLTTNEFSKGASVTVDGVTYPTINKSYFPTTIGDYLYYITLPEEYDTYENRKYLVKSRMFDGWKFLDYDDDYTTYTQSWCCSPEASCAYSKGMTTSAEISEYSSVGYIKNGKGTSIPIASANHLFPEIIIEADEIS